MNIVFVSPEVFPFSRAGGLGDVSNYLPQALVARGHRLWVITPKYRTVETSGLDVRPLGLEIKIPMSWQDKTARIFESHTESGARVLFVGCDELYNRDGLYGNEFGDYEDNAERFTFFSRAVMEIVSRLGLAPDVFHCHDWPTGLVPVYARTLYRNQKPIFDAAQVFTFHNLGSQGIFWHYDYAMTGLGWELFTPEGLEFHGRLNMTKAGLVFANLISTVSRTYAAEVLTPEYAFGLEGVLASRRSVTHAVLNGVDYSVWDPATDVNLAVNFSAQDLSGKAICRRDLERTFGLSEDDRPIVAVVSRLLDRKGFDLIGVTVERMLDLDLKFVFMGRGEEKYHGLLTDLSARHPERIGVKILFDKSLAHRIMAGADIFLMPSRYEPCGLEQLYAMKYGTVPVVRATGGLSDTVVDVREDPEKGTGFKFLPYNPEALYEALEAAAQWRKGSDAWTALMRRGMACDFSWNKAAAAYETLYQQAIDMHRQKTD